MKIYQRLLIDDERPVDDWGRPIGPSYEKKDWEQLSPEEMVADFEWKSDILAVQGEEVSGSTFYQDYLFHELYGGFLEGYKVIIAEYDAEKGNKMHLVEVDEIEDYLELNDVALSPCLFYDNWKRKKLLNYVGAFVLDIDKLRPQNLQRFFKLFDEGKLLRPTFIANSGSGVHFYYLLDKMLKIDSVNNEANNQVADEIYKRLYDDVIKKEKWKAAQRHWIGQDYRVVNSRTKLNLVSRIFKTGEIYTIEQLLEHYDIQLKGKSRYATKSMVRYAGNIARNLDIEPPEYSNFEKTYEFIRQNKDAAYEVRQLRREEKAAKELKKKKKAGTPRKITWYRKTLSYMMDHTQAGYRFSSMKALAYIAHVEKVPREDFIEDLMALSAYWEVFDWQGDHFNSRNVEAIIRFFDHAERYSLKSETLEDWLGYEFRRIGNKRNGQSQADHLEEARAIRDIRMKRQGKDWRYKGGAPTKEILVNEYVRSHPEATVTEIARAIGVSRPTVYKWMK